MPESTELDEPDAADQATSLATVGSDPTLPLLTTRSHEHDGSSGDHFQRAKWALMGSYAMAACAWRSWEFAVALLLIRLYPHSLFMVSVYGLVDNAVRITGGASVGGYVSRSQLFTAARVAILWQNACIGASTASAAVLLTSSGSVNPDSNRGLYWTLMVVMVGFGALSSIGSTGVRIAVENKAVARLCAGNSAALATTNSSFRAIDLAALLAAPLPVGVSMTWFGPLAATAILAAYTLCAWVPELLLLQVALASSSALRATKVHESSADLEAAVASAAGGVASLGARIRSSCSPRRMLRHYVQNWGVYVKQAVLLPNMALALLYCTVLSLGFLMTSYMSWIGLTEAEVSVFRGIGAVTGLSATAVFPALSKKLGVVYSGLMGSLYQYTCLVVGVSPLLYQALVVGRTTDDDGLWRPSVLAARFLIGGVVASRTGLWLYDLAVTQLVQEGVAIDELGMVCGVQSSLQASFETLSFLAALYLSDPSFFFWLVLGSMGFVTTAAALYIAFVVKHGGKASAAGAQQADVSEQANGTQTEAVMPWGAPGTQPASESQPLLTRDAPVDGLDMRMSSGQLQPTLQSGQPQQQPQSGTSIER